MTPINVTQFYSNGVYKLPTATHYLTNFWSVIPLFVVDPNNYFNLNSVGGESACLLTDTVYFFTNVFFLYTVLLICFPFEEV